MAIVRVLTTVRDDLTAFDDFVYPEWNKKTGTVNVVYWKWYPPNSVSGLHGITKDFYKYPHYKNYPYEKIKWMVIEVDDNPDNLFKLDDYKVTFKEGNIIYQGDSSNKAIRMVFDDEQSLKRLLHHNYDYHRYLNLTYDLAKIICTIRPYEFDYILHLKPKLFDYELAKIVCSYNASYISHILSQRKELVDYELAKLTISQNGYTIDSILAYKRDLVDYDLCQLAVNQSEYALNHILQYKPELVTDELKELHKKLWE